MRRIVQSLIFSIATSNIAYAAEAVSNKLNYNAKEQTMTQKVLSKFSFNYFAKYTGRSLSDSYQDGATYNRFDGGKAADGSRRDATGSTQLYQSFKLSYKLPLNMKLSYGVTYQDNLNNNIKFKGDSGDTLTRSNGRSYNDHRVALWVPNIVSGSKASLSSSFFYQLPTTDTSKDNEMKYAVGIQPTLSIYSKVPGLYHGLTASIEKGYFNKPYYERETVNYTYSIQNLDNTSTEYSGRYIQENKQQGVKANIGAYLNYAIAHKVTLKSSIDFDYDQVGKQVGTFNEWGNNMDNVGNLGAAYSVRKGVNLEGGVNFSLEEASIDKSAIFGSLSLSI